MATFDLKCRHAEGLAGGFFGLIILGACSNSSGGLEKTEAAPVQLDEARQSYLTTLTPLTPRRWMRRASSGRNLLQEGERRIEDRTPPLEPHDCGSREGAEA